MRAWLQLARCVRVSAVALVVATQVTSSSPALAGPGAYSVLSKKAEDISKNNLEKGWGLTISGGLAVAFALPAFYISSDLFARVVYSAAQTAGLAAIGYGTYLILVRDEYTRFKSIIDGVPSLSLVERDQLSSRYLESMADRARQVREIKVVTHGTTALLNFANAFTIDSTEFRVAMIFIGGVNTLAAISAGFVPSEEEEFHRTQVAQTQASFEVIPSLGWGALAGEVHGGMELQLRF